jgi:hypothetical protein
MNISKQLPSFEDYFPLLNRFILGLVENYRSGKINSWDELDKMVKAYFTSERIREMEAIVPGWHKMASYSDGITLVHVMCVFMGLYMMPEFLSMTKVQQQTMKWIILLHDVEKEPQQGKRDHAHAFRSAVGAARTLPKLGFPITVEYDSIINDWGEFTCTAITISNNSIDAIQDNRKLLEILSGIERMFGHNTPAALIIKTILFHLSVDMQLWPPAAPLTAEEVTKYFDRELVLLLRVMNLGDGEGWSMFDASRETLRKDTLEAFKKTNRLISAE